ncbi:MAG: aldo/keto reductase [Acidobacteria bacterium RIFCSPLOWO2_02_FULL_61_28]|nr:MAG: aldo/keto reductase [Acidobacteria bacterium RIFCSPLOWO2_02_FULL_61_28]
MEKRRIGSLEVSVVGLGCNNFGSRVDADTTAKVVEAALDAGINFFDTADIYGGTKSEEFLGPLLKPRRNEVVIATKFGMPVDERRRGAKPDYVRRAVEDSLRRLQTDRIDLYQLHQPDPETPIEDTLGALDDLVRAGKVHEIGCSNFSAEQIREAEAVVQKGAARFVSVQNEYSLLRRDAERDVLPECERRGIAFLPYFPLASGLLSGKYRRGQAPPAGSRLVAWERFRKVLTDQNLDTVESLLQFATARRHTLLELAISWLAMRPAVASVIAGATQPGQVKSNAAAAGWRLSAAELAALDAIVAGPREAVPGRAAS